MSLLHNYCSAYLAVNGKVGSTRPLWDVWVLNVHWRELLISLHCEFASENREYASPVSLNRIGQSEIL